MSGSCLLNSNNLDLNQHWIVNTIVLWAGHQPSTRFYSWICSYQLFVWINHSHWYKSHRTSQIQWTKPAMICTKKTTNQVPGEIECELHRSFFSHVRGNQRVWAFCCCFSSLIAFIKWRKESLIMLPLIN